MMDAGILEDVLSHIHNWFVRESFTVSDCQIVGGSLPASVTAKMLDGMWYRIEGSYLNDGLHQYVAAPGAGYVPDLADETFDGTISLLAIPRPLLRKAEEIADWQQANGSAASGPYESESFGGYSYSLKSDSASSGSGGLTGWRLAFRNDLNPWRKMA